MSSRIVGENKIITELLNGTIVALKTVVPVGFKMTKPLLIDRSLDLKFGALIGVTGDVKGKLILAGETSVFGAIGEMMFGMSLKGDMLQSFSGELSNMLAGRLSTNMAKSGFETDITAPSVIQGDINLTGYKTGIQVLAKYEEQGDLSIFLLLD